MSAFFFLKEALDALHRGANAVDAHTLIALEYGQALVPERSHGYVVPARGKFDAEIAHMAFFPINDRWIDWVSINRRISYFSLFVCKAF